MMERWAADIKAAADREFTNLISSRAARAQAIDLFKEAPGEFPADFVEQMRGIQESAKRRSPTRKPPRSTPKNRKPSSKRKLWRVPTTPRGSSMSSRPAMRQRSTHRSRTNGTWEVAKRRRSSSARSAGTPARIDASGPISPRRYRWRSIRLRKTSCGPSGNA